MGAGCNPYLIHKGPTVVSVQMTYPQHTTDLPTLFRWPSRSALPIGARCSDDLAASRGQPKPYTELFTEYQILGCASHISFGLDYHHWVCIKSYPPVEDTTMWFWFKILFRLVDRHKVCNFKLVLVSIQWYGMYSRSSDGMWVEWW